MWSVPEWGIQDFRPLRQAVVEMVVCILGTQSQGQFCYPSCQYFWTLLQNGENFLQLIKGSLDVQTVC